MRHAAPTIVAGMLGDRGERLARGEAGGDDVLDHQHPRAGRNREAAPQLEDAVLALDEDRLGAEPARGLVARNDAPDRGRNDHVDRARTPRAPSPPAPGTGVRCARDPGRRTSSAGRPANAAPTTGRNGLRAGRPRRETRQAPDPRLDLDSPCPLLAGRRSPRQGDAFSGAEPPGPQSTPPPASRPYETKTLGVDRRRRRAGRNGGASAVEPCSGKPSAFRTAGGRGVARGDASNGRGDLVRADRARRIWRRQEGAERIDPLAPGTALDHSARNGVSVSRRGRLGPHVRGDHDAPLARHGGGARRRRARGRRPSPPAAPPEALRLALRADSAKAAAWLSSQSNGSAVGEP